MSKITPFIKWPGGKKNLLKEIRRRTPNDFEKYIEPFVGAGSVLLDNLERFDSEEIEFIASDYNQVIITAWKTIQKNPEQVINYIEQMSIDYQSLSNEEKAEMYYDIRGKFNISLKSNDFSNETFIPQFIFLNMTGYNGLYRTSAKSGYNVPFGKRYDFSYNIDNIINVSKLIKNVKFIHCSFEDTINFLDENTFVYLDPPYKPVTKLGPSTNLYGSEFSDDDQRRVAEYLHYADSMGAKFLMSNSYHQFFIDLYDGVYDIDYVYCSRNINRDTSKRGPVQEIMVRNFACD